MYVYIYRCAKKHKIEKVFFKLNSNAMYLWLHVKLCML